VSGVLNLVSVGPGASDLVVPRAEAALRESEVIVAYELYLRWIGPWLAGKGIHTPPLTQERERARLALDKARGGARVGLISSGDIGVYAMAALAFEEMGEDDTFSVNVIPGITSANACASLLGSPLSHDYATLSLSDLLCPWEWIEHRARHIAQADLACVLYNVQSTRRWQGIYRILRILLEHKLPATLCGVVRNAYRSDQQVRVYRLEELETLQFDMFTTIVIGNRFTRRKRHWIFTPRGYGGWKPPVPEAEHGEIPGNGNWVFSGTSDGNALTNAIAERGYPVIVSTATDYGREVAQKYCPGVHVWAGRRGIEARRGALTESRARALIDATHPYAARISRQLMSLSQTLGIPYLRYERPSSLDPARAELCGSPEQAARRAIDLGARIFLATGSKDLAVFLQTPGAVGRQWFTRMIPEPEFLRKAIEQGLPPTHICAMQGPFSQAFNEALWRDWDIDCVVTRDSGDAGGYQAKAAAAAALRVPLLVIKRPRLDYPVLTSTFTAVLQQLEDWGIKA